MENIIKKEKPQVDTLEKHRLSFCDNRHPLAKKIEAEITEVATHYQNAILKARRDKWAVVSRLPLVEERNDYQREEVALFSAVIQELRKRGHEELKQLYKALRDVSLSRQFEFNNIIPTVGRTVIAMWITGDDTYPADSGANYGSLGTSNTAPTNGDTQLTAETYRKATSSAAFALNVAYLSNFYSATEVSGTFEEAGWHIYGTATANSGQLLSHFLTGTIVKSLTETLTCESALTLS